MPPSLIEIGRRLGYASRYDSRHDFLRKFPELCQAILDRRAAYRAKHRNGLRVKLEPILLEDPPPTLNEVTKRLGYKDSTSLLKYYPKLCRVIVKRHAEYRKVQFKAMRHKLAAILHEESPSSLRAAARRLGYNACYLGQQFPDVSQAIAKRHASFRKRQCLERKKEQEARIRAIALHLDSVGGYPSRKRVKEVLNGPMGLNNSEVGAVLREVRTQLNKERLVRRDRAN